MEKEAGDVMEDICMETFDCTIYQLHSSGSPVSMGIQYPLHVPQLLSSLISSSVLLVSYSFSLLFHVSTLLSATRARMSNRKPTLPLPRHCDTTRNKNQRTAKRESDERGDIRISETGG